MQCFYLLFTHCSLDNSKSKHNFYRSCDSMNNVCTDLKKMHATETTNFEKKEILALTKKKKKNRKNKNSVTYVNCNSMLSTRMEIFVRFRITVILQESSGVAPVVYII